MGICGPAELETAGELDTPDTAVAGADAGADEAGTCCTAAACLTPKTAGGQSACHPATTRAPPKRATATGTITGALSDHPRLVPGAGSRVDGVARTSDAAGSGSRPWLPSVDSCWEAPWSEAPHSRQKCANSLLRCPHLRHRRSPANVKAPPKQSISKIRYVPSGAQWRIGQSCAPSLGPGGSYGRAVADRPATRAFLGAARLTGHGLEGCRPVGRGRVRAGWRGGAR